MLHARIINPAEIRRSYFVNLVVAACLGSAGAFAWWASQQPKIPHADRWFWGSLVLEIFALWLTLEATKHWRILRDLTDEETDGRAPQSRRALGAALRFVAGLPQRLVSLYRATYAAFDFTQSAVTRLGFLGSGAVSGAVGGFLLLWAYRIPAIVWKGDALAVDSWLGVGIGGLGAAFLWQGIGSVAEALRFNLTPKNAGVHGTARPADEREARDAARGKADKSGVHEQSFRD
jgi:hypothetical protein